MTQIAQQSMVNAPNQNQLGALYVIATKTGNQAFINQFPNIMTAVNNGIQNPGWGAYGQAAMYQAIAPGANYWHAQLLSSQGAFGTGDNGKTNLQNMLTYAYKNFGGNTDQGAVMLGQWAGIIPSQAKQLFGQYFDKNGNFNIAKFTGDQGKLQKELTNSNYSSLDKSNNNYIAPGQTAQGFTSNLTGIGGWLYDATLGNPMTQPLLRLSVAEWAGVSLGKQDHDFLSTIGSSTGRAVSSSIDFLSRMESTLGKFGGPLLSTLASLPQGISDIRQGQAGKGIGEVAGTGLGTWGGVEAGAVGGAALGSIIPGLGTAVGGVIGGILGGMVEIN
ncbi:hypothetical protein REC12_15615 [Desulfosporosinus sp. PR]|nr:hypothetical protein [Desulfosporosinus sp. PR]